ncbi:hypothetical protein M2152_000898 [Microbacteriaceae bacterium SG_E_30_P1]|uniref:DUF937 domain-containing protein n=1 Tax=Antiquaquibacter oligotrophicus TaxID=2880260 RepID=A0ABT6KLU0_9MICO|nr:DUF937 domain-containing protein [Antiquaquibacter oligotrophicus]MDH6180716.1 hypothetical protein [Antiquaquibacter oligotrophicus]UDF13558.1 DUF937 domain-containing protein [Antiquaquibacter oligotrophicus]
MTDLSGLMDHIPISDIARKLGVDESVARAAVDAAVPAIVGGLAANAKSGGEKSLESALSKHAGRSTKLADIDEEDGKKIVKNVFGTKTDDVVAAVSKKADTGGGIDFNAIVQQVLPIIAPIVLAYLANQFSGGKSTPAPKAEEQSGGDLGSLIGGLLGSQQGQDLVGGLLGGLLGGGRK